MTDDRLMTVAEFAELVKLTPNHIRRLARQGKLRHVRVGGAIRIPRDVIEEMTVEARDGGS